MMHFIKGICVCILSVYTMVYSQQSLANTIQTAGFVIAEDDFNTGSNTGGTGWGGPWLTETSPAAIEFLGGALHMGAQNPNLEAITLRRLKPISSSALVTLSFDWECVGSETFEKAQDFLNIFVSEDNGANYTQLSSLEGEEDFCGSGPRTFHQGQEIIPIQLQKINSPDTVIKFSFFSTSINEIIKIDNIKISSRDDDLVPREVAENIVSGEQYYLISKKSNKCLDVYGGNPNNGTNVVQWSCNNANQQKFELEHVYGSTNTYIIKPVSSGLNSCIDVYGGNPNNGTNVVQWSCNNANQQKFELEHVYGSTNTYIIKPVSSGLNSCLDVYGGYTNDGANVVQWSCNGANNQEWLITKVL